MRGLISVAVAMLVIAGLAVPGAAAQPRPEVPFVGDFSGTVLGFDTDRDAIAARCSDPSTTWAVTSFEGWGTATHLGRARVVAEHCSYSSDGTPQNADGTYGEGLLTLVAANGDILRGAYGNGISTSPPPVIGFQDDFVFTDGGTGRFATASGGGTEIGSVDVSGGAGPGAPFSVRMDGVISYGRD